MIGTVPSNVDLRTWPRMVTKPESVGVLLSFTQLNYISSPKTRIPAPRLRGSCHSWRWRLRYFTRCASPGPFSTRRRSSALGSWRGPRRQQLQSAVWVLPHFAALFFKGRRYAITNLCGSKAFTSGMKRCRSLWGTTPSQPRVERIGSCTCAIRVDAVRIKWQRSSW